MWSYCIERSEPLVYVCRHHAVYTSVSFTDPNDRPEMITWMLQLTKEIMKEFPDEYSSFIESVTIPYLNEMVN